MKKRTEILAISLVLTGSALAASFTSDIEPNPAEVLAPVESTAVVEAPADPIAAVDTPAPELDVKPVVYEVDIPMDIANDHQTPSP